MLMLMLMLKLMLLLLLWLLECCYCFTDAVIAAVITAAAIVAATASVSAECIKKWSPYFMFDKFGNTGQTL